ncbi:hypothetical protein A2866_02680 [Candidatus Roizmanbacteria bacterium RIFCSPHIGHO2_01_FULL_39_8]|uniref:Uncharacterized protein n=3 Tax=Candidatus Roizmaniibacteriota TaxID=1752723 RepID=A0A1F7GPX1_9BACT|nr:MAG: hypothetical protein A2866_02680 [Candidatus Roizmanbacteria bacterium RIFCSPHIGHO2_01_FULL_39_8]OGK26932.1 MAG: hypothetical protein A3C28_06280 [Candidatus Roizmanbacteria bacterium RIFCSPHIGHO2_02_FULL_39_9]OGK37511.1 MAG: hypothetical protein A3F60_04645 [Candidatus Roizmanbacteria bacterium RIFCSPHIGHO2_12_FULL_39_8]
MKKIVEVLKLEVGLKAKHMGKPIAWFQFAKKTKYGYRFLTNKEAQWKILQEIAERIAQKYPQYTTGQIVDLLSEIVNT